MELNRIEVEAAGVRFAIAEDGKELARAFLYVMHNDQHRRPFGLLEDVYVEEAARGRGLGTRLVQQVIKEAEARDCYKLIATSRYSRPRVHELYKHLNFKDHGVEFRMEFRGTGGADGA